MQEPRGVDSRGQCFEPERHLLGVDARPKVASSLGGLHVDTHHHRRSSDPAIYSSDGVHANARGHAIAFAAMVQALAATIAR